MTTNPTTPPEPQAGATPRKEIKRYSMLTMMGISVMRPEPDGEYVTYQDHIAALATSRAETEAALKKQPINTSLRLFDLVRYMRSELHQKELITDEEYAELCMGPMAIDRKNGGSPSPRRLEEYDALRAQLATLTATLAQREAEVAEAKRWTKVREEEAEDLRSRAVFKTLADRCYDADRAEMDLFDTINRILGCDVEKCNDEGFKWGITDCWTDDYDGSVEVIRGSEQPELTREQADAILALGFGMIYESPADANTEKPEGIHWTVTSRGWCHPKRRDGENVKLVKMQQRLVGLTVTLAQRDREIRELWTMNRILKNRSHKRR